MAIRYLLDASAVLAYMNGERGAGALTDIVAEPCGITSVNLAEVVTKQLEGDAPAEDVRLALAILGIEVLPVEERHAYLAAALHAAHRRNGLSLGDTVCLGTAQAIGATAVTADRGWASLGLEVEVRLIR